MEQVKNAAERANALQFIIDNQYDEAGNKTEDFGAGFDRKVGPRGAQVNMFIYVPTDIWWSKAEDRNSKGHPEELEHLVAG